MNISQARACGYEIQQWRGAFHCTPMPVHPDTCYGRAFATEAEALAEAEARVAYRLQTTVTELREHLQRISP